MIKKSIPLSEAEKALFEKNLRNRLWIAIIFGIPLLTGIGFMSYQFLDYQMDVFTGKIYGSDWGFGSYFFFFFLVSSYSVILFYFIPLYFKSFKNTHKTHKVVVKTKIQSISKRYRTKAGFTYTIHSDYIHLDTYYCTFLTPIKLDELEEGMTIEIHHLEGNNADIIKIITIND